MAVQEVITVGDSRLRQRSRPVKEISPEIRTLIADMIETMHEQNGVGLAAPQVAQLVRLIVIEMPDDDELPHHGERFVVINPEIAKMSRDVEDGIEGCLSIPGYIGEVERSVEVVVRGLDERGKKFRIRAKDYLARVFQHEIDHLNGVLYIDRLTAPDRIWEVKPGEEEQAELEAQQGTGIPVEAGETMETTK